MSSSTYSGMKNTHECAGNSVSIEVTRPCLNIRYLNSVFGRLALIFVINFGLTVIQNTTKKVWSLLHICVGAHKFSLRCRQRHLLTFG